MRRVLGLGIGRFARAESVEGTPSGPADLTFAADRVDAMSKALARFGYDAVVPPDSAQLTGDVIDRVIRETAADLGTSGVLIVHVVGHGEVTPDGALYVVGADGARHPASHVEQWLRRTVHFDAPLTLFVLDLCHAGTAARLSWQVAAADGSSRCWVLAACGPDERAYRGRFSKAFAAVLNALADSELDIDVARPHIPLGTVAQAVRREVKRLADLHGALQQEVTGTLVDIATDVPDLPFFPNPGHRPEAARDVRPRVDIAVAPFYDDVDEALDPAHFIERAAGQGEFRRDVTAGCFSGRKRELITLSQWCDGRDDVRLRVVSGSPGVGKSALVGVVVCAAHPVLRRPTRHIWEHVELRTSENERLAAVHARQRSLAGIVASLARQLGLSPSDGESWDVADLLDQIRDLPHPPVVVVDALDEAVGHRQVMTRLLLPLSALDRPDGGPACRLLVAMRPWPEFEPLRAAAEARGGLTDLDSVPQHQLKIDLEEYVFKVLRHHPSYAEDKFAGARATFAAAVAKTLTRTRDADDGQRWGEFLVAGLYTHHLVEAHEPVTDNATAWTLGEAVPRTLPDLFELDLSSRTNPWLRPVLTALAHARGEGMPVEVLRHAAAAFASATPERRHIVAALRSARFYLRGGADVDGMTLYRLFHQGLSDHLRRGLDAGADAALAEALLAPLAGADGRRWDLAEPYLLRHAAGHCADAGRRDLLADDAEYLVVAEPSTVDIALAGGPCDDKLRDIVATTEGMTRRYALAVHALRAGRADLARRLSAPPGRGPLPWRPAWLVGAAREAPEPTVGLVLGDVPTSALAVGKVRSVPHAVVATADGTVTCWRLDDAPRPLWTRRAGHPVLGLSIADYRGVPPWIVVTDDRGGRRAWYARSGDDSSITPPTAADGAGTWVSTEDGALRIVADDRAGVRLFARAAPNWCRPAGSRRRNRSARWRPWRRHRGSRSCWRPATR